MGTVADDLVANIQAGHELFVAQLPPDENSPSARKLAALIQNVEEAIHYLAHTAAPKTRGIKVLREAVEEAKR